MPRRNEAYFPDGPGPMYAMTTTEAIPDRDDTNVQSYRNVVRHVVRTLANILLRSYLPVGRGHVKPYFKPARPRSRSHCSLRELASLQHKAVVCASRERRFGWRACSRVWPTVLLQEAR